MLEILLRPAVLAPTVLLVSYVLFQLFLKPLKLPDLPILGAKEGDWFPLLQAKWRNTKDFKNALKEHYAKYKDQTVLCPIFGAGTIIILPVSQTQFVIDQPDNVLSLHEQAIENLQTDYTVTDAELVRNPLHHKLIATTLTNQIGNLIPDVADECSWSFDRHWGEDTKEWKEICVYDTMRRVIGSVSNRVFVGAPACRDQALLSAGLAFAQDVPITSNIVHIIPKPLRYTASLLITLPNRLHTHQFFTIIRPEIERRLQEYDVRHADPEKKAMEPERNDFLQWSVNQGKETGDLYHCHWKTLAGRVLLLNFAAVHTSSFSITNTILDLISSKKEYIDELREEVTTVLAEHGGEWNKRALAKMNKLDSVLRESARLNSFVTLGLGRLVVAKDGLTTPSGVHIPKGNVVFVPSYSVLYDDNIYPDAQTFKPFWWADQRTDESVEYVTRARNAFATTSNEYLAFGHGRGACPGRFFAANELKLLLGHLLLNYEFEMQEKRPKNMWFGLNRVPPMTANIKIRRREKTI
ncbi:cytochrome P450 [Pseudomassariella vexata]|uniref:Cytochrome P450 n=1 Tax=Pseudomassariella vexata TaxID=1141098 RepID=A0A1Y2EBN4_9PEZI|nr:cytochrome P450 [Pseudomassariella vexata]ORY68968.1 cytochrome P450 [Pseudomassariella vexata]